MPETRLVLTVPEALAGEFEAGNQEFLLAILERGLREMKIDRALELYRRGGVSFGAAAEHAGVPASELAHHAYARGMTPPFSLETLEEEIA